MKKIIQTQKAPQPIGPYNQAVMSNDTLYVSGQIPMNPETGKLELDDIETQTHRVMKNIQAILKEAGMDFSNVVKCSIFISEMQDFPLINKAYAEYFTEDAPARETVQVARLPLSVDVEISCIASIV